MILKIKSDLKNQIEENINVHKNIFNISRGHNRGYRKYL